MKPSVNTLLWSLRFTPLQFPILADIKRAGADCIELPQIVVQPDDECKHIASAVADAGLNVSSVVTVMSAETDPSRRETGPAALDHLKRVIDALYRLRGNFGGGVVCGPIVGQLGERPATPPTPEELQERWARAAEVLAQAGDYAAAVGKITLAIEPLNRFELVAANRLSHAVAIAGLAKHPRVGVMFDTHHMHLAEGGHPEVVLEHYLRTGWIRHGHISHHNRGVPGLDDQINYAPYFAALRQHEYDGYLAIEAFGRYGADEQALQAATCTWHPQFHDPMEVVRGGLRLISSLSHGA